MSIEKLYSKAKSEEVKEAAIREKSLAESTELLLTDAFTRVTKSTKTTKAVITEALMGEGSIILPLMKNSKVTSDSSAPVSVFRVPPEVSSDFSADTVQQNKAYQAFAAALQKEGVLIEAVEIEKGYKFSWRDPVPTHRATGVRMTLKADFT